MSLRLRETKGYFQYRYKDYLWMLLAFGIGSLAVVLFSDKVTYTLLPWLLGGLLVSEVSHFNSWCRNNYKGNRD
ncbi:hypothetical protein BAVI_13304 [Neobacillus vireti LMG 21834]|uniref:Uncharacterized protein n=1 Tax=Neobacillus vireti LMG 21834 TaxID=1131730 RepID=A0AB94IMS9_9BACI|nr:hypothetical protein BAVI_13304 [Neobacillus vireti LMG 21834]KLT16366.1 hypothetical protein AA980_17890 [Neobacillus vireti]